MHLHKSWVSIVAAFILLSFNTSAQDAQEDAIRKAITDQNTAFKNRDIEAWSASWLQDAKTSRTSTNMFGSTTKVGWNNVSEGPIKYMKENPTPDSLTITNDSFVVRKEGNVAIVDYKESLVFPNAQAPFNKSVSREQNVLVKKNGKWLIAASTSTDITHLSESGVELSLNAVGYKYLFAGKTDEAVKVLELNTLLFPNSFNVWDSLGEAYAKAGNKEKAIECYEKSLAIYPANDSGKKALAELK